jgi:hypothetical protein
MHWLLDSDFNGAIKEMEELQEVLRNAEQQVSTNLVKELKLNEVSTMHKVGPIVYD